MVDSEQITSRSSLASHSHIRAIMVRMVLAHARPPLAMVTQGAWHGMSATALATTVGCSNDAEVLGGLLSMFDSHEFVFARWVGRYLWLYVSSFILGYYD
jgi:hypothetical protein